MVFQSWIKHNWSEEAERWWCIMYMQGFDIHAIFRKFVGHSPINNIADCFSYTVCLYVKRRSWLLGNYNVPTQTHSNPWELQFTHTNTRESLETTMHLHKHTWSLGNYNLLTQTHPSPWELNCTHTNTLESLVITMHPHKHTRSFETIIQHQQLLESLGATIHTHTQTHSNPWGYIPLQPRVIFDGFENVVCKLYASSK